MQFTPCDDWTSIEAIEADPRYCAPEGSGEPEVDLGEYVQRATEDRLRQRLDNNREYLALASPTAAQQRAQVARLTRENNALIRLVLGLLDTADDTGD